MEGSSSSRFKFSKFKSRLKKLLNFFLNLFGKKTKKSFSSVISHLLEEYEKEGLVSLEEKKMFRNITYFGDKKVSSIMTPRADLVAINYSATLDEIKKVVVTDEHSRIPVFKDNFDEIVGFIHSKDLAKFLFTGEKDFEISKILRKILFVPGSMKLLDVMLRMRVARVHIAIVLDEFGGVDGLVTIENIVEEIVGDIEDEHDLPSTNSFFRIKKLDDETFEVGGRVEIKKLEEVLKIKIRQEDDEFQTVSGLIMSLFNRVPEIGEEFKKENLNFKVIDADTRVIRLIEVTRI